MIWSYLRWALVMLLYGFLILTSYILFPLFYLIRNWLPERFLYFDISEKDGIYGDERWREERGYEYGTFKTAWFWCVKRNPVWNFWLYFKPKKGKRKLTKVVDETNYNDWRDNVYLPCQIKTNVNNFGNIFNPDKSILGKRFIVYKIDGTTYWNWSKAFNKKDDVFIEWELGYNQDRYLLNRNRKKLIKNGWIN